MLKLINVSKIYQVAQRETKALDNVSVDFRENEFVAILGHSGSGKTTMLNIIGGLDKYTKGDLVISGKSTKKYKDKDWDNYRNKRIGFVFQSYNLIAHLNVLENVELALTISGISPSKRRQLATQALEKVGLGTYLKNRPTQLSGGQMQRVAIARALVNSPEILLADEPTGALDSETSTQIMQLIKQIANERLVIMVTHNSELAKKYASRIINLKDGKVVGDTNAYKSKTVQTTKSTKEKAAKEKAAKASKTKQKTAMSFLTALGLSLKNLFTKKARTIMISVASSIGIIGVCLVLALSSGLNNYIERLQAETIALNPLTITEQITDTQAIAALRAQVPSEKFPSIEKVLVQERLRLQDLTKDNNITNQYIDYIKDNIGSNLVNDIMFKNGVSFNLYTMPKGEQEYVKVQQQSNNPLSGLIDGSSLWQQMPKQNFVASQYDMLYGTMPTDKSQVLLVVNEYNMVRHEMLVTLGLKSDASAQKQIDFADIIGHEFKLATNNQVFVKFEDRFLLKQTENINMDQLLTLKIAGIARIKQDAAGGVLRTGLVYLPSLTDWLLQHNLNSEIVNFAKQNPHLNVFEGEPYQSTQTLSVEKQHRRTLTTLGGVALPNEINIYAKDLAAKQEIKDILMQYNHGKQEKDTVFYSDMSEILGNVMGGMIDTVTYVLVSFSSISLIVSSIMIAILTYVSVIERTKEIGILRSIGARKKDVSRVFNAENFILGFFAGMLGVIVTYVITVPLNNIIYNMVGVRGVAALAIPTAVVMLGVSIILCVLSGLLSAKKAAKKDPVLALRTE